MKTKRILLLALLFVFALCFAACGPKEPPASSSTTTNNPDMTFSEGLAYTLSGDKSYYTVSSIGSCTDTDIVIPATYEGKPVKAIGKEAFYECSKLTSVTIPDGVESIGSGAFSGCSSLESMTIPFVGGSKTATSASSSTLFGYIFGTSSYTGGVSTQQYYALGGYNYYTYYIPSSLTSVTVTGGNIFYGAFFNCKGLTSITISDSVESIGSSAFYYCSSLTSVTIGNCVTSIGSHAFEDCNSLTSVTIPGSVTNIGEYAFAECYALTSITIGHGVTSIGQGALFECIMLKNITVANDNTAFASIDNNLYSKDEKTFIQYAAGKTNHHFTIPDSVENIAPLAFAYEQELISVTMPDSVTSVGYGAFQECFFLTSITIPDKVTSIGNYAFQDCSSLTSITIPNSVTSIGSYAFFGCKSLTSVTIGNGVQNIGAFAFNGCIKLVEVINHSGLSIEKGSINHGRVGEYALYVHNEESKIEKVNDYLFITDENGTHYLVNYIGKDINLTLPSSYNGENYSINQNAFFFDINLTSVVIPNSVTSIGNRAFSSCYKLVEVINHSQLSITKGSWDYGSIAEYALYVHNEESKIENVDDFLFFTDENGTNYLVGYIGNDTALTLPETYNGEIYEIYQYAFYLCRSLTSIVIPDSVTSIGDDAFYRCTSLTNITIPDSVTSIGSSAFYGCSRLSSIKYRGTEAEWNAITKHSNWDYNTGWYIITYNYDGN